MAAAPRPVDATDAILALQSPLRCSEPDLYAIGTRCYPVAIQRADEFYSWWTELVLPLIAQLDVDLPADAPDRLRGARQVAVFAELRPDLHHQVTGLGLLVIQLTAARTRGNMSSRRRDVHPLVAEVLAMPLNQVTLYHVRVGISHAPYVRRAEPLWWRRPDWWKAFHPRGLGGRAPSHIRPGVQRRRGRPRVTRGPPADQDDPDPDPDPEHEARRRSRWAPPGGCR